MFLLAICMSSLEKHLFRSSVHFLFLLCFQKSCMSCLYFQTLILCQLYHLKIFSPILWVVVYGFLYCEKAFKFKSHLLISAFIFIRRWIQKDTTAIYVKECSDYVFLLRALQLCGLTLRSLIHSEFIFVYGVRECSNVIQMVRLGGEVGHFGNTQGHFLSR